RRTDADGGDPARVAEALAGVARLHGVEPARLRMLDYAEAATRDPALPELGVVLATFGTWKAARRRAATPLLHLDDDVDELQAQA
ncbi:MAG: hypothetical protein JWO90_2918, partial [Solirubrobacterales bacterium]|nr:hypothetical protein [Solirubrobacterales bacterium]